MCSAAMSHVKMAKVSHSVPDTSVRGLRSNHTETKSKPACSHRHGAREKSGILNINTPIFLTPPREQVQLTKLMEKKVGVTGHFEILFSKNHFSYSNTYKNRHTIKFGVHFDGVPPRNLKAVSTKNWRLYVSKPQWRSHLEKNTLTNR